MIRVHGNIREEIKVQPNLFQLTGVDQVIPIKGIEGAKAYPIGANCRVPLFDENENIFYVKTTDENGFPSIRIFDYTERIQEDETKNITLNDIRTIIKEELANAQQLISESGNSAAAVSAFDSSKSDASTKPNSKYYTKPKQPKQNSPALANGEEQQ